jgi:hypothetical protein
MLPGYDRTKRLLVQAPMAIPHWRAHEHRHWLRPARAMRGGRHLLFLPVHNAFCARSSCFGFSDYPGLQRILHIAFICTLSHSPQSAPRQANGLSSFWPIYNQFWHRHMDAVAPERARPRAQQDTTRWWAWKIKVPRSMRTLLRPGTGALRSRSVTMHSAASLHIKSIYRPGFLNRQSAGDSNTLPGCCPRSRGNLKRLRAC